MGNILGSDKVVQLKEFKCLQKKRQPHSLLTAKIQNVFFILIL